MIKTAETYHVSVLLKESVDGLAVQPGGIYVDVTFGGGGHSREILGRLGKNGRLFGFDQDADAESNIMNDNRFTFVRSNFRYLKNWMRFHNVEQIDGLLADLGVSSHHFDDETRGFSFRFDAPLDMRMNKRAGMTAADVLNNYTEEQLADIFYLYGELKNARKLASVLVIFVGAFWPIFVSTLNATVQIDKTLIDSARMLRIKERRLLFEIILPAIMPQVLTGCSVGLIFSFILLASAEMIGATSGIGWYVKYYSDFGDYGKVIVGILFIGLVVTAVMAVFDRIQRHLLRWQAKYSAD